MRKSLLFPVAIILLFWFFQSSNAFMGDDFSLNMYENIDEWIDDLEKNIYKKYLQTDRTGNIVDIKDKISELTNVEGYGDCFISGDLSATDIENVWAGNIGKLFEVMSDGCKDTLTGVPLQVFINNYYNKTKAIDDEAKRISEEQAEVISEIARIWIYSDGNDENSPFDLISDIQDIDNIIFSKEIPYFWVNQWSASNTYDCLYQKFLWETEDVIIENIENSIVNRNDAYIECQSTSGVNTFWENFELEWLSEGIIAGNTNNNWGLDINFSWVWDDGNSLVCQDSSVNSGLSPNAISELVQSITERQNIAPISSFLQEPIEVIDWEESVPEPVEYPENTYAKMKDNDWWPCTEFFCIVVEFTTENYNLLTGGKTKSIEAFLSTSNEHLKKWASTSLVQSKMTQNNFEMAWRDLNLPDLFNATVQIQFMPPPILNLDKVGWDTNKETEELWDDFTPENLLTAAYLDAWMDNSRRNDMRIFLKTAQESKSLMNTQELSLNEIWHESTESALYQTNDKTNFTRSILDKKVNNTDGEEFYLQFSEVERFAKWMKDYSFAVSAIIQKMREIPILE